MDRSDNPNANSPNHGDSTNREHHDSTTHISPSNSRPHTIAGTSNNAATISAPAPRIRRRNRMITSCLECRRRKLKCNKSSPCTNCVKFTRDCVFLAPALDQASQLKLTEIKEKVGSLERLLERDVAKSASQTFDPSQGRALPDDADDNLPPNEDGKVEQVEPLYELHTKMYQDLEPTPLASLDAAYDVDGDDDDLLDLGIQLGRMRLTERLGGFFRPKISQEIELAINDPYMKGSKALDSSSSTPAVQPLPPAHEWLKPSSNYIAPTSGFFFGQAGQQASLIDFLPSRLAADRLIKQYFVAVHPIAQVLHRPSFEREYNTFWDEVSLGIEPASSVQAIIFSVMFAAVVSMDPSTITRDFGVAKESLVDNFKLGTETALNRANFLRTTKVETLQALILYMIPLCRAEVSRAHSVLVGAAIRMAECMGLHRDGEYYGLSPLETHVRRLIWHQLCFLDIRTCEAQGPRPTIRSDDFDTKLPLNVDDIDLHNTGKPLENADRWTDATFSLIRFEINEMNRTIWVDRPRVQQRKISLTAVLSKIETFRQSMAKYDSLMDDRVPVQRCARIVKTLLLARLHVMLLHSYHNAPPHRMPDRLLQIMLTSGLQCLECAIALETIPHIKSWEWYSGAFQQYHAAFLLLIEVYCNPYHKEADRIWPCIDYVFGTDSFEPRLTKARKILSELQQKTAIYAQMRGMRAPLVMNKLFGLKPPQLSAFDERASKSQASGSGMADLSSIGRVAVSDVLMAPSSVNEPFWTTPERRASYETNSESSSPMPQQTSSQTPSVNDDILADIDWETFDALFPPEQLAELGAPIWPTTTSVPY